MSWDLLLFTAREPAPERIAELARPLRLAVRSRGARSVAFGFAGLPEAACFTLELPCAVEAEDQPDVVLDSGPPGRFLVQLSVPAAGGERAREAALRLGQAIAAAYAGVVYDPQEGVLLAREVAPATARLRPEPERIRVVELGWWLVPARPIRAVGERLLALLRAHLPEALPRRYGDGEPFQHRFDEGDVAFLGFWHDLSTIGRGKMFFWSARRPCFGGHVALADPRDRHPSGAPIRPDGVPSVDRLSLSLDDRAIRSSPELLGRVVDLFAGVAGGLDAFFAAGWVERNVRLGRALGYDEGSERLPVSSSAWFGLPPVPTWLSWIGPAYRPHVEPAPHGFAARGAGLLFRAAELPADTGEAAAAGFPAFPAVLVAGTAEGPVPGNTRLVPARTIPDLRGASR